MENGSNVAEMLHDEINIMFIDWPETKKVSSEFFNCIIIVFFLIKIYQYILYYKLYCKIIYFHISKLTLYVFITEMDEYIGKQEEEEDMDISTQELIPLEEDEDINDFITELFNENNTLPKCELDQWLEDYLEEMELQQKQEEGEQNNKVKNYQIKTIFLFWICVNTVTFHQFKVKKILLHQVSVKKIR